MQKNKARTSIWGYSKWGHFYVKWEVMEVFTKKVPCWWDWKAIREFRARGPFSRQKEEDGVLDWGLLGLSEYCEGSQCGQHPDRERWDHGDHEGPRRLLSRLLLFLSVTWKAWRLLSEKFLHKSHSHCFLEKRLLRGKGKSRENSGSIAITQERNDP